MSTIYGQALVTIPSSERIGIVPTLQVLLVCIVVFTLSFQKYLTSFQLLVSYDILLPADVCDLLIMLSFPATLMFMYVVSNIRMRLNLHIINAWSIIHTVLLVINLTQTVLYIIARPDGCFAFMTSVVTSNGRGIRAIVDAIKGITNGNEAFRRAYTIEGTGSYKVAMFFASYSFIVEALFVTIFVTMSCSLYGETQAIVTIKGEGDTYTVDVRYSGPRLGWGALQRGGGRPKNNKK